MLATVRRFFQQAKPPQPEPLQIASAKLEPEPQSPDRPRLLGPRFTEPPSPFSESRSRSRSRSPTLGELSPPASPVRKNRRSSIATRKRLSFSRSPPIQRRRSFANRRSVAARSRVSFPHRDFANPEAETCWLSCLFQALWHSVVFHAAFEQKLAPEHYPAGPDEALLAALQQTWSEYKAEGKGETQEQPIEAGAGTENVLVGAEGLVGGFGEGYGDMSEALACLQSELSESTNLAAIELSNRMVCLPLAAMEGALPSPEMAWKQAQEWQVTTASLIAVDITVPQLMPESIKSLARLWVPKPTMEQDENAVQDNNANVEADAKLPSCPLGGGHQLVALVCYMWHLQHYVAFCRRQSNSVRCCFFNDLPELTRGVPKEVEWQRVPDVCAQFSLTPRLALYESTDMAGDMS